MEPPAPSRAVFYYGGPAEESVGFQVDCCGVWKRSGGGAVQQLNARGLNSYKLCFFRTPPFTVHLPVCASVCD